MSALKAALESFINDKGGGDRLFFTPLPDVVVMRTSQTVLPEDAQHMLYTPALCVVAQGAKQIRVGDDEFDYNEGNALVVSVELPGFGCVTRATAAKPYLGMTIGFDIALMREVMEQLKTPPRPTSDRLGVFIQELSDPMQDCVVRLARVLATPDAIPILYPSIIKELYFWLLTGPNGGEICKIVKTDSHTRRIADAIHMVRRDFTRPIRVEEMAETARMSPSSFHQHFKTMTAMSPLQYLKQLRLLEARRLMVTQALGVTSAAFHVGYESASQFSREYTRMFGRPPKQDAQALKARVVPA
jgi:AraC-like DNA-binding protein